MTLNPSTRALQAWQSLGREPVARLSDARLQLHWAAQIVASVGRIFVPPRPDDSHPNMEWWPTPGLLVGNLTATNPAFRAAIDPARLVVVLMDADGKPAHSLRLAGTTADAAYRQLERAIGDLTGMERPGLEPRPYDIPHHPVASGASFSTSDGAALGGLARWFSNADRALRLFVSNHTGASPVRCWPHHFDVGTLVPLDADGTRSVGLGMTPGDEYYDQPYWYVNPYPTPGVRELPELARGHWHRDDWVGAVLTGVETEATEKADDQADLVNMFLETSFAGITSL